MEKKDIGFKKENTWEKYDEKIHKDAFSFCEGYKDFLDFSKTERETTKYVEELLIKNNFVDIENIKSINTNKKGKKVKGYYKIIHKKAVIIYVDGKNDIEKGLSIIGSHIDAPRIDLKPNPIYQDSDLLYFKTHYYGGIKKYQWVTIPLAIHGVFVKENGDIVEISIGEKESDPVFTITDLLPHLAQEQMQKKLSDGINGEELNILIGSIPEKNGEEKADIKDKVKVNILKILNSEMGIIEEDFISSEIEIVPAFKAKDVGFDRSMIGAYGQDDRVCSYIALKSILDMENPSKGCICFLSDKEEIGSFGNTGAQSKMFENFLTKICQLKNKEQPLISVKECLTNSKMLSADVNAGFDPTFASVFEKNNSSFIGRGVVINKYTGSRGKAGASDANAEYVAIIRNIFNSNNIVWQASELGKVDIGGGGTIAYIFANMGIDVIDCGVPILSMHSPFEIASKMDIYTAYLAYKAFYEYTWLP